MYKKIYLEITNICNLNCDFCMKNTRPFQYMEEEDFKKILDKIKNHTHYLYFHLLGEPTMHPKINHFIDLASKNFQINITTNGYLIDRIEESKKIRQINISLHSFHPKYKVTLEEYMEKIFDTVEKLKENTYISYRIWQKNESTEKILNLLEKKYQKKIDLEQQENNITLEKNVFLSKRDPFIWPSMENEYLETEGTCYALKDHIGILVDGTVVPCCLDAGGTLALGNILETPLEEIINSPKYQQMLNGFKNHQKIEPLCRKCQFLASRK